MSKKARRSCGNLEIELKGYPKFAVACNCLNCQKRTGSVFRVSAYLENEQIMNKKGERKLFNDVGEAGRVLNKSVCPNCGATVYWEAELLQACVGIAVSCFEDPKFPEPVASAWNRSKHEWVTFPSPWQSFQTLG